MVGCNGDETIARAETEKEANEIQVKLIRRGVSDVKIRYGSLGGRNVWEINVPRDQANQGRQLLVDLDLPRTDQAGFEKMIESSGLIPTKTDERARLMYAMAGEIATTLEEINGVITARVHIVLPESKSSRLGARKEDPGKPAAVVLIKHAADARIADVEETQVNSGPKIPGTTEFQMLVAKSVEGLSEADVTVKYTTAASRAKPAVSKKPKDVLANIPLDLLIAAVIFAISTAVLLYLYLKERKRNQPSLLPEGLEPEPEPVPTSDTTW